MVKSSKDVISEFNNYVNMTSTELEKWLKSDDSNSAGWPKNKGEEGGETVGHDSGRKIVEILNSNPDKDPEKYTEDQIQHMRKVASYCKRHLAQESAAHEEQSAEDVKKTRSYASLKNWGHDPLKTKGQTVTNSKTRGVDRQSQSTKANTKDDENEETEEDEKRKSAGDKRKKSGAQGGVMKKHETRKGAASKKQEQEKEREAVYKNTEDEDKEVEVDEPEEESDADKDEDVGMVDSKDTEDEQDEMEDDEVEDFSDDHGENKSTRKGSKIGKQNGAGKKSNGGDLTPKNGPKKGDEVSWNWGSGQPTGKVLDVREEETTITTKRGNKVTRKGNPEDPAVVLDTGKSKAIKSAHELN